MNLTICWKLQIVFNIKTLNYIGGDSNQIITSSCYNQQYVLTYGNFADSDAICWRHPDPNRLRLVQHGLLPRNHTEASWVGEFKRILEDARGDTFPRQCLRSVCQHVRWNTPTNAGPDYAWRYFLMLGSSKEEIIKWAMLAQHPLLIREKLVGRRAGLDAEAWRNVLCTCRGSYSFQFVVRYYTDSATPAP
jgi:hypothetical protein